jgi:hypothetical protein
MVDVTRAPSVLEDWRNAPSTDPNVDGRRGKRDVRRTPSMVANIGASGEIVSEPCPAATKERRGLSPGAKRLLAASESRSGTAVPVEDEPS